MLGLSFALTAQTNPTPNTWIELPKALESEGGEPENLQAGDSEILDVLVGGGEFVRFWYTTNGIFLPDDLNPLDDRLHSGRLRPVDLRAPLPSPLPVGQWPQGSSPSENWIIRSHVVNWNQVHGSEGDQSGEDNPPYSKRNPLVGFASKNGMLFVAGSSRNEAALKDGQTSVLQWNGLTVLDGAADPTTSFDPATGDGKELYSFGGAEADGLLRLAVPEGVTITSTSPPGAATSQFLIVDNYCGTDGGGTVLVQSVRNLMNIRPAERHYVQLYELLGDLIDSPGLAPIGPLGPEVCRYNFTCPLGPDLRPDCSSVVDCGLDEIHTINTIGGNKIRPVIVVDVPSEAPFNAGRKFLIIGMNLDPMDLDSYGGDLIPLDLKLNALGMPIYDDRDDGKYDYLAIVDISGMVATMPNPVFTPEPWPFDSDLQWRLRTRFLQLPPDLPATWSWGNPNNPPLEPGHDWSFVTVPHPADPNPAEPQVSAQVRIVGSGTPKTLVADPDGRFVYVVTSDQGQEDVAENATLFDGGWHVPHLYVIDLWAGDFTDQMWINAYAPMVPKYRFNKVITHEFPDGAVGSVLVKSTIPGMPLTDSIVASVPTIGQTRASGAPLADIGSYYPGESQLDPSARTRMAFVRNQFFGHSRDRLYIGLTGETQPDNPQDHTRRVGAVLVLTVNGAGEPGYLRTLTLDQSIPEPYQVAGMEARAADGVFVNPAATHSRNVVFVTALSGKKYINDPQDRLVLMEDPP